MRKSIPLHLSLAALAAVFLALARTPAAHAENLLENPGFESGIDGWTVKDTMSQVVEDEAHEGKASLQVVDDDPTGGSSTSGSSVMSTRIPVLSGQEIEVSFWAKSLSSNFIAVYFWFSDGAGKMIKDPANQAAGGLPICPVKDKSGDWVPYDFTVTVPEGAESVALWIHSYSTATGTAWFDDFSLTIKDGASSAPVPPTQSNAVPEAAPAEKIARLPANAQKGPIIIIIKADDLKTAGGGRVSSRWIAFTDFIKQKGIKASIGIICNSLETGNQAYFDWIKGLQATGLFEFWFHGWDHAVWTDTDGTKYNEFMNRSYEDLERRFDNSQKLAVEKLGFSFATFGPPGGTSTGTFSPEVHDIMAADPHMKAWLYPKPIDEPGRKLEAGGKVAVLDRVWKVNIEQPLFVPSLAKLREGLATYASRRNYFVIQGHPAQWDEARFAEFTKIVDFLIEQNAVFMTPAEFVESRKAGGSKTAAHSQ